MSTDDRIKSFSKGCIDEFGSQVDAIVLTGSYAKGDYTSGSDVDIWMVLNSLQFQDLKKLSRLLENYRDSPEINLQCVTSKELLTMPFKKWFSPVQIYIDGIVLHGKLPLYIPYSSEIRNYAASIAVQVYMSARHYITTSESEESLCSGRLVKWIVKPLSWVFRYNILLSSSIFPRNFDDLKRYTIDGNEREIVKAYSEIMNGSFKGSYVSLNELCHDAALRLSKI